MGLVPLWLALAAALDPAVSLPSPESGEAEPPAQDLSIGVEVALFSTYVFRGELQYGRGTVPSFQPSVWLELPELGPGALCFELFSAFAMSDWERLAEEGVATEVDLGLAYRAEILDDWLQLGGGFLYYVYPHGQPADGEKEVLVELGIGNLPITPSVGLYTEVHPGLGLHVEPRIAWEQQIGQLTIGTDVSMGASIYRGQEATLDHTTLTVGLAQQVGALTLAVTVSYAIRLAPGRGDFLDRSLLYGSLALRYEP